MVMRPQKTFYYKVQQNYKKIAENYISIPIFVPSLLYTIKLNTRITKIEGLEYHCLTPQWELLPKYRTSGKMKPRGHVSALSATF